MESIVDTFFKCIAKKVNIPRGLRSTFDVPVSPSGFKSYHAASVAERESLHVHLNDLVHRFSWVEVSYVPRGFDDHELLERINITSSRDFLGHIGEPVIGDQIAAAIQYVMDEDLFLPVRFENIKMELYDAWGTGKRYYSCNYDSSSKLVDALRVIEYLHQQLSSQSIDYRSLSVYLFNDSKWFEQIKSIIASLLKPATPELDDSKPDAILAYWGLYRFPPSLQIKGNLTVKTIKGLFFTENAWPFIGIPPDAIREINVASKPAYVLFIENKTTFERYCREVDDAGLIIYTNGFPSRHWHSVFKSLDSSINTSVNFYHWGDVDLGGFKILRFMSGLFKRPLHPHQMDMIFKSDDGNGAAVAEILTTIGDINQSPTLDKIILKLSKLGSEKVIKIEQETLELKAPMAVRKYNV